MGLLRRLRGVTAPTVSHPPDCPDCGAEITVTVDAFDAQPGAGASGVAIVQVRLANPLARYRTEALKGAVATFPTRCGCGALFWLTGEPPALTLEVREEVEWGDGGWPARRRR
jgi:hypothetical protein